MAAALGAPPHPPSPRGFPDGEAGKTALKRLGSKGCPGVGNAPWGLSSPQHPAQPRANRAVSFSQLKAQALAAYEGWLTTNPQQTPQTTRREFHFIEKTLQQTKVTFLGTTPPAWHPGRACPSLTDSKGLYPWKSRAVGLCPKPTGSVGWALGTAQTVLARHDQEQVPAAAFYGDGIG